MTIITRMQEITIEINSKLDNIQNDSLSIGKLLSEAKEEILGNGGSAKEFLAYCATEFSLSKSQAYKLVKVSEVFADDHRFKGVAMRVLYSLASNGTPEHMDTAARFAENDSLTMAIVNEILGLVPKEPVKEQEAPKVTPEVKSEQQAAIDEALNNVPTVDTPAVQQSAPVDDNESPWEEGEKNSLSSEIAELRGALQAANEMIKSLQAEKVTHNKAASVPMLPQFKSKCAYAVLGLSEIESKQKTKIKSSFRAFIKCGYGDGHQAFDALTTAKDTLLEAIEA